MRNAENSGVWPVQQLSGIFMDLGSAGLSTLSTILSFYLFILMLISAWS